MSLHTRALLVLISAPFVAVALVLVAGTKGALVAGLPLFAICIFGIFVIQWIIFIQAHLTRSERYFDLTGSLTFLAAVAAAAVFGAGADLRSLMITLMVVVWAVRLGSFLFLRVRCAGRDSRFEKILPDFRVHLMTWTLQAIWVSVTVTCALIAITSSNKLPIDLFALVGAVLWVTGFSIEVIADNQKTRFRRDPRNAGRFITTGLWSWSRHPNYFGEILLWFGVAVAVFPVLEGAQFLALLSPLFVVLQMTRISGVDMLERMNDRTWRDDPEYLGYKEVTSKLIPWPPTKAG